LLTLVLNVTFIHPYAEFASFKVILTFAYSWQFPIRNVTFEENPGVDPVEGLTVAFAAPCVGTGGIVVEYGPVVPEVDPELEDDPWVCKRVLR